MSDNRSCPAPEGKFCQSCGMPIEDPGDCGTNKDGTGNDSYCRFCYSGGRFNEPDITLEGMIEKVVGIMKVMNLMPEEKVREAAGAFIPTLERWKKRGPAH